MTASRTAIEALVASPATWEDYRTCVPLPIDLTLASLRSADLRGRNFESCDLSGADLSGASLDRCTFADASLRDALLSDASLVHCQLIRLDASGAVFDDAVIRDTVFTDADLTGSSINNVTLTRVRFHRSSLRKIGGDNIRVHETQFVDADLSMTALSNVDLRASTFETSVVNDARWLTVNVIDCRIKRSTLNNVEISNSVIRTSQLVESRVTQLALAGSVVEHLDCSGSVLCDLDLETLDLPSVTMLNAAIIRCRWPRQRGSVSLTGRYERSPHLLGHPVQDIRGLTPSMRREVADAQFLDELSSRAISRPNAIAFRVWGATTAHGQSILRLSAVSLLLLALLSAALCASILAIDKPPTLEIIKVVTAVLNNFFGIDSGSFVPASITQKIILVISRVGGFFILGLWIGVAANRLGRLSSE